MKVEITGKNLPTSPAKYDLFCVEIHGTRDYYYVDISPTEFQPDQ